MHDVAARRSVRHEPEAPAGRHPQPVGLVHGGEEVGQGEDVAAVRPGEFAQEVGEGGARLHRLPQPHDEGGLVVQGDEAAPAHGDRDPAGAPLRDGVHEGSFTRGAGRVGRSTALPSMMRRWRGRVSSEARR